MYRLQKQMQKYTFPAIWQNKIITVLRGIGKSAGLEPRGLSFWFIEKKKIFTSHFFCIFASLKHTLWQQKNSMTETDVSLCDNFKSIKQEIFNPKYHRKPIDHNIHSLIKALNKYVERNLEKN